MAVWGGPFCAVGCEPVLSVAAPCELLGGAASANPSVSLPAASPDPSLFVKMSRWVVSSVGRSIGFDAHLGFYEVAVSADGEVHSTGPVRPS
jgi:hypothetical protein